MVVPSNLDDRQILFSNEEDDATSHTASKNAIPLCAAEWHFLDLVKVLVEVMNFMRKLATPISNGGFIWNPSGVLY